MTGFFQKVIDKFQKTMKINIGILLILNILFNCTKEKNDEVENLRISKSENNVTDFYNFKNLIPESDFAYDIKITGINFKSISNAFEFPIEKYGVAKKQDGLLLSIAFDITNPYNREMNTPFPDYYQITAPEFQNLDNFIYSKSCRCHISNSFFITDNKKKPLSEFSKYTEASVGRQLLVNFKAKETKHLIINFEDPFPDNVNEVTFIGFNKHFREEKDYYSLDDDEKKVYLEDNNLSYGLKINVKEQKIINLLDYK